MQSQEQDDTIPVYYYILEYVHSLEDEHIFDTGVISVAQPTWKHVHRNKIYMI